MVINETGHLSYVGLIGIKPVNSFQVRVFLPEDLVFVFRARRFTQAVSRRHTVDERIWPVSWGLAALALMKQRAAQGGSTNAKLQSRS
jgi:hypothetical protein